MGEEQVCAVTGGRGFAARHLVLKLLEEGRFVVRILDLAPELRLSAEEEREGALSQALASGRAHYKRVDLRGKSQVVEALKGGVAVVFHMAAPNSSINSFKLHFDVTVIGTRNVIEACWECGVKKLVHTSSPSVVFDGVRGIVNGDESLPIPDTHNDFYSDAKAHAEGLVLSANGKQGLLTCAIRPSGIFGPGDRLTIPAFAASARSGKLKFVIGDGENLFDWTYVENVVHAHLCAEKALVPGEIQGGENVASGKAYFITNLEPIKFWQFVSTVIERLGYPKPKYHIPIAVILPLAQGVDWIAKQLAPLGVKPPSNFSAARMRIVTTTRTFNCARAVKLLGYKPMVPLEEGIRRTVEAYPHLRADVMVEPPSLTAQKGPSRTQALLGNNRVADVLLWRNPKMSVRILVSLLSMMYLIFASGYTLISLLANFLFFALVILFVTSYLPDTLFGISLAKALPPSPYELSEPSARQIALAVRSSWNLCAVGLERIAREKDFTFLFKAVLLLRVLKFFGKFSFQTFLSLSLFAAFTLPYLYEQYEEEFDKLWLLACETFGSYWKLIISRLPAKFQGWLEHK